jgi:tetratricopeptide (TPR) repeat protein
MTDDTEAPEGRESFEEHPLYQTAVRRMAQGNIEDAATKLNRLVELYPDDQALQDLSVRVQLMATLDGNGKVRAEHGAAPQVLRNILVLLLVVTLVLVGIAAFTAAYNEYVLKPRSEQEQKRQLDSERQSCQALLSAGDWAEATDCFEKFLTRVPGDATALAGIEESQQQADLDRLYQDAVTNEQQGNYQAALDLLHQVEARSPGFLDVQQRILAVEKKLSIESAWLEAQNVAQAGNWTETISLLLQIRAMDGEFHRAEVRDLIFQAYAQLARQQISQANGDLEVLRQARYYLDKALQEKPTNQDLIRELGLVDNFIAGFEASASGDWVDAVVHWEAILAVQPDYQGGVVQDPLRQAYPKAARQLIAQANGSVGLLRQAVDYLNKALAAQPGDQELSEERRLATEYVAGADAAALEQWSEAIAHWGAIYTTRPDYQNGALEDRLRQACASAATPDAALCPP